MAVAGELTPATRLLRILLNCLVIAPAHPEVDEAQSAGSGASDAQALIIDINIITGQQLRPYSGYLAPHGPDRICFGSVFDFLLCS